jgi:hypothetical protein
MAKSGSVGGMLTARTSPDGEKSNSGKVVEHLAATMSSNDVTTG